MPDDVAIMRLAWTLLVIQTNNIINGDNFSTTIAKNQFGEFQNQFIVPRPLGNALAHAMHQFIRWHCSKLTSRLNDKFYFGSKIILSGRYGCFGI